MNNLEQLARIINQHQLKGVGGGTVTVSWSICTCEHTERTHGNRDYAQQRLAHHQAQAIIDAGWTPPVEPAPTTCADCGEPVNGDKYTGDWVLRKPQGQHWEHIHRNRCPIRDRPLNN